MSDEPKQSNFAWMSDKATRGSFDSEQWTRLQIYLVKNGEGRSIDEILGGLKEHYCMPYDRMQHTKKSQVIEVARLIGMREVSGVMRRVTAQPAQDPPPELGSAP